MCSMRVPLTAAMSSHPFPSARPAHRPRLPDDQNRRELGSLVQQRRERAEIETYLRMLFATTPDAWVTRLLLIANVSVFLAMVLSGAAIAMPSLGELGSWGGLYGPMVAEGEYWRLITATFVHGGIVHLGFNMWVLWQAGPLVERLFGNRAYLTLYLIAGLGGTVASFLTRPVGVSVGASGAIFGVVGALLAYLARSRDEMPAPLWKSLRRGGLLFVALNVALGMWMPGIDNAGHLGGLLAGFLAGYFLVRPIGRPTSHSWTSRLLTLGLGAALVLLASDGVRRVQADPELEDRYVLQVVDGPLSTGQFPAAQAVAEQFVELRPEHPAPRLALARVYATRRAFDAAERVLSTVDGESLSRDRLLRVVALKEYVRGHELLADGLPDAAYTHFAAAAASDPTFAPALHWKGRLELRTGAIEAGTASHDAARTLWPDYPDWR